MSKLLLKMDTKLLYLKIIVLLCFPYVYSEDNIVKKYLQFYTIFDDEVNVIQGQDVSLGIELRNVDLNIKQCQSSCEINDIKLPNENCYFLYIPHNKSGYVTTVFNNIKTNYSGNWSCHFELTDDEFNSLMDSVTIAMKMNIYSIEGNKEIIYILSLQVWHYVLIGVSVALALFVVCQCCYISKIKKRNIRAVDTLSGSNGFKRKDDFARYSKTPHSIHRMTISDPRESGIYECLNVKKEPVPEPPPISTLPAPTPKPTHKVPPIQQTHKPVTPEKPTKKKPPMMILPANNTDTVKSIDKSLKVMERQKAPTPTPITTEEEYEVMGPNQNTSHLQNKIANEDQEMPKPVPKLNNIMPNQIAITPAMIRAQLKPVSKPLKPTNEIIRPQPKVIATPVSIHPISKKPSVPLPTQPVQLPTTFKAPFQRKPPAPVPIIPQSVSADEANSSDEEWTYEPLENFNKMEDDDETAIYNNYPAQNFL